MQVQSNLATFEWFYSHLGLIGWPALVVFVWRASKWVTETTAIATKAVGQIDTLATNHFPHMEESLRNQDELIKSVDGSLKSVDSSLKTIVERTPKPGRKKT